AFLERVELVLETTRDDFQTEVEEVPEDRLQIQPLGPADLEVLGRDQAREVDNEICLERRVLEQVRHDQLRIGVLLDLQRNPHIVGGDVLHVDEQRQLARQDDIGNALDERGLVHRVWNAR